MARTPTEKSAPYDQRIVVYVNARQMALLDEARGHAGRGPYLRNLIDSHHERDLPAEPLPKAVPVKADPLPGAQPPTPAPVTLPEGVVRASELPKRSICPPHRYENVGEMLYRSMGRPVYQKKCKDCGDEGL